MTERLIREYITEYTDDDIHDGDIDAEAALIEHHFDTSREMFEYCQEHISGEGSMCPIDAYEAAQMGRFWISRTDEHFCHGSHHARKDGLGGTVYEDHSWHFGALTERQRYLVFQKLALAGAVYGMKTWRPE